MPKKITMTKGEFTREHRHLVKVLREGTPKERKAEAKKQARELKGKG